MSLIVMLGGLLILVQGVLDVAGQVPIRPPGFIENIVLAVGGFVVVGVISILAGVLVLYGGWMISKKKKVMGSRLALLFAIVGFAGGGGFLIGTILGFVGGIMNFRVIE